MSIRLEIINNALVNTGNAALNIEYDGTPEWQCADVAFRRAVDSALQRFRWAWAKTQEPLASVETVPSPRWAYAYRIPVDALHVVGVYLGGAPVTRFECVDTAICCDYDPAQTTPGDLTCLYVRQPPDSQWPAGFREFVTRCVEADLYRSLNEDPDEARRRERDAELYFADIRSLTSQESGKRAVFKSRTAQRRRIGGPAYRGFP